VTEREREREMGNAFQSKITSSSEQLNGASESLAVECGAPVRMSHLSHQKGCSRERKNSVSAPADIDGVVLIVS